MIARIAWGFAASLFLLLCVLGEPEVVENHPDPMTYQEP